MIKSRGIVSFALAAGIVMTMFSSVFAAPAWDVTGHLELTGKTGFDWRSRAGEMEIDLVRSGSVRFSVGEREALLSDGDAIWINSGHLHSGHEKTGSRLCGKSRRHERGGGTERQAADGNAQHPVCVGLPLPEGLY